MIQKIPVFQKIKISIFSEFSNFQKIKISRFPDFQKMEFSEFPDFQKTEFSENGNYLIINQVISRPPEPI